MERSILVERKVRAHPVVVGRVIRQQVTEVPFPQHHHSFVEAAGCAPERRSKSSRRVPAAMARHWSEIGTPRALPNAAFDLHLPARHPDLSLPTPVKELILAPKPPGSRRMSMESGATEAGMNQGTRHERSAGCS